jgi:hypothetical protein
MIRPRNLSGEGAELDWGIYETHGETKCGSVVAAAIASTDPASGISGLCAAAVITAAVITAAVITAAVMAKASDNTNQYGIRTMVLPEID